MYAPIIGRWFRCGGDVGCVTIVPGVALVREVVEARDDEDDTEGSDSPSTDWRHGRMLSWCMKGVVGSGGEVVN